MACVRERGCDAGVAWCIAMASACHGCFHVRTGQLTRRALAPCFPQHAPARRRRRCDAPRRDRPEGLRQATDVCTAAGACAPPYPWQARRPRRSAANTRCRERVRAWSAPRSSWALRSLRARCSHDGCLANRARARTLRLRSPRVLPPSRPAAVSMHCSSPMGAHTPGRSANGNRKPSLPPGGAPRPRLWRGTQRAPAGPGVHTLAPRDWHDPCWPTPAQLCTSARARTGARRIAAAHGSPH